MKCQLLFLMLFFCTAQGFSQEATVVNSAKQVTTMEKKAASEEPNTTGATLISSSKKIQIENLPESTKSEGGEVEVSHANKITNSKKIQ